VASEPARKSRTSSKWYAAGLAFECQQSGNCCSGAPGYVWVNKAEIAAISRFLGRSDGQLSDQHLRRVGWRYSLTERADGDCVFLERGPDGCTKCKIHKVKPTQCRTWPFWDQNLKSPDAWAEAGHKCPGINRGPMHDFVQIEAVRLTRSPA
jgi:Fe-S-cluster containining protein